MEAVIYFLKVNMYCTLFYMYYWLLLRRHTFFKLNRLYLVSTLFLSLALPLIEFTETIVVTPVVWFYKYSLREVHEFLVDQQAESKNVYADFLVSYAQNMAFGSITNNFFNSFLLKDRIRMIYSKSTSHWSLYKYFLIVPVISFTLLTTAAHNQIIVKSEPEQNTGWTDNVEKSRNNPIQDSTFKTSKKKKTKLPTYTYASSTGKSKNGTRQIIKLNDENSLSPDDISENQDSLRESNKPKHSFYNYNSAQKVKKIDPLPSFGSSRRPDVKYEFSGYGAGEF